MGKRKDAAHGFQVFDKVAWHYPEGKDCPSLEAGRRHIEAMLRLLGEHGLLSEEGREALEQEELGPDFSLTSDLVTPEGEAALAKHYDAWLKLVTYGGPLHEEFWEGKLGPKAKRGAGGGKPAPAKSGGGTAAKAASKQAGARKGSAAKAPPAPANVPIDAVAYHWPIQKGKDLKTIEDAKGHLNTAMRWFSDHDLLTPKGKAAFKTGSVADDFAMTGDMLTPKGLEVVSAAYGKWFGSLRYGKGPHPTDKLDQALRKLS
jgi:hypothetical protein